jgi:hypothetical protein
MLSSCCSAQKYYVCETRFLLLLKLDGFNFSLVLLGTLARITVILKNSVTRNNESSKTIVCCLKIYCSPPLDGNMAFHRWFSRLCLILFFCRFLVTIIARGTIHQLLSIILILIILLLLPVSTMPYVVIVRQIIIKLVNSNLRINS